jgi:hypothetical protein
MAKTKRRNHVKVGLVLLDPKGKPCNFSNDEQHLVGAYIQRAHKGIILDDDDVKRYRKALEKDRWKIVPATLTVSWDA